MEHQTIQSAEVHVHGTPAGVLYRLRDGGYRFSYRSNYDGDPVSLTLPVEEREFQFDSFPAFFDGLLPEGWQLDALLRTAKLDRSDYMGQLLAVGADTVGAVTIHASNGE